MTETIAPQCTKKVRTIASECLYCETPLAEAHSSTNWRSFCGRLCSQRYKRGEAGGHKRPPTNFAPERIEELKVLAAEIVTMSPSDTNLRCSCRSVPSQS